MVFHDFRPFGGIESTLSNDFVSTTMMKEPITLPIAHACGVIFYQNVRTFFVI